MNKLIRFGFILLLSLYTVLGMTQVMSDPDVIEFVAPLPTIPAQLPADTTSDPIIYTVKNNVDHEIHIAVSILDSTGEPDNTIVKRIGGTCGSTLAAKATCTLIYTITAPTTTGAVRQTLLVEHLDGREGYDITSEINFRSTSEEWVQAGDTIPGVGKVWALLLDESSQTLYAGINGGTNNGGVYSLSLTKAQASWQTVGTVLNNHDVVSFWLDKNNKILYAGTTFNFGVYSLNLNTVNPDWIKVGTNSPGSAISSLVLDSATSILYAADAVSPNGIKQLDLTTGGAWTQAGTNKPYLGYVFSLALDATTRTLYAGTHQDNNCPPTSANGVYSLDLATTNSAWTQIGGGVPGDGNLGPLVLDTINSHTLYAGLLGNFTGVFGLNLSSKNSWSQVGVAPTTLPGSGLVQSLLLSDNTLYAGTGWNNCNVGNTGVWATNIIGNNPWSLVGTSGFPTNVPSTSLAIDSNTYILYAGTSAGVFKIQQ